MPGLHEVLPQIRERAARYRQPPGINEQNTKAGLIDPVIRALGWDTEDLDEVHREFKVKSADKPVDYALLVLRTPRLFIEAKSLGEDLSDRRWANQIMGYASVAGVEWVVLTDGDEYRIFNSHAPVPIDQKLFRSVRISDASALVVETLQLLSKERMSENYIQMIWQAHYVDRQIKTVVTGLFTPETDPSLVRLIRKRIPTLSPAEIRAAISRAHVQIEFPDIADVQAPEPIREKPPTQPDDHPKGPGNLISFRQLIDSGIVTPPLMLEKTYKGHRLTAHVDEHGRVWYAGTAFNSPSTAASIARKSIIGAPRDRKYPQTNGWIFWQFRDDEGVLRDIDILRRRFKVGGAEP